MKINTTIFKRASTGLYEEDFFDEVLNLYEHELVDDPEIKDGGYMLVYPDACFSNPTESEDGPWQFNNQDLNGRAKNISLGIQQFTADSLKLEEDIDFERINDSLDDWQPDPGVFQESGVIERGNYISITKNNVGASIKQREDGTFLKELKFELSDGRFLFAQKEYDATYKPRADMGIFIAETSQTDNASLQKTSNVIIVKFLEDGQIVLKEGKKIKSFRPRDNTRQNHDRLQSKIYGIMNEKLNQANHKLKLGPKYNVNFESVLPELKTEDLVPNQEGTGYTTRVDDQRTSEISCSTTVYHGKTSKVRPHLDKLCLSIFPTSLFSSNQNQAKITIHFKDYLPVKCQFKLKTEQNHYQYDLTFDQTTGETTQDIRTKFNNVGSTKTVKYFGPSSKRYSK